MSDKQKQAQSELDFSKPYAYFSSGENAYVIRRSYAIASFLRSHPDLIVESYVNGKYILHRYDRDEDAIYYRVPSNKKLNRWYRARGFDSVDFNSFDDFLFHHG